jgi:hypothetical protein
MLELTYPIHLHHFAKPGKAISSTPVRALRLRIAISDAAASASRSLRAHWQAYGKPVALTAIIATAIIASSALDLREAQPASAQLAASKAALASELAASQANLSKANATLAAYQTKLVTINLQVPADSLHYTVDCLHQQINKGKSC